MSVPHDGVDGGQTDFVGPTTEGSIDATRLPITINSLVGDHLKNNTSVKELILRTSWRNVKITQGRHLHNVLPGMPPRSLESTTTEESEHTSQDRNILHRIETQWSKAGWR